MKLSRDYSRVSCLAASTDIESKKKKRTKNNPWAICHHSTGPGKTKKFEDCVQDVKKKNHYHE